MAFSGGTFSRLYSWVQDAANGLKISSTRMDAEMNGMATGLSTCLLKDGTQTVTANIPFASFKLTGVGSGTLRTDAANVGQIQDAATQYVGSVSGTNTITGSVTPALTAYAAGQVFRFIAANTNSGATTLNINGVGAKNITTNGTVALVGGEIVANAVVTVIYDGTQFQIQTVNITALNSEASVASGDELLLYDVSEGAVNKVTVTNLFAASTGARVLAAGGNVTAPADTNENTLATITIPANALGANGQLNITADIRCTNNANAKTLRFRYSGGAGTVIMTQAMGSTTGLLQTGNLYNKNATNAQTYFGTTIQRDAALSSMSSTVGVAGVAAQTTTVDTTASTTLLITAQKATAGDTIVLDHYTAELLPSS